MLLMSCLLTRLSFCILQELLLVQQANFTVGMLEVHLDSFSLLASMIVSVVNISCNILFLNWNSIVNYFCQWKSCFYHVAGKFWEICLLSWLITDHRSFNEIHGGQCFLLNCLLKCSEMDLWNRLHVLWHHDHSFCGSIKANLAWILNCQWHFILQCNGHFSLV